MMPNDERMARPIERSGMLYGGRWIACAGLVYVVAWLIGLAIGFGSSSPGPTDSVETIGAYFSTHREAAMLQAYLTQGIAGAALLIFAAALANALRRFEGDGATVSTIAF